MPLRPIQHTKHHIATARCPPSDAQDTMHLTITEIENDFLRRDSVTGFFLLGRFRPKCMLSQFYLHTHTFIIRNRNEPYLPLPSQRQLVLIYRPRRDGRLSRPWCEVAQAETRTRNLPITSPVYSTTQPRSHLHLHRCKLLSF